MAELKYTCKQILLRSQVEIQEEALHYISQEIHDNIGQVLSLVKLQLNTLPIKLMVENVEAITASKDLVSKAIADLRSLNKSLQITGSVYKIPVQTQTILFRMVQEAISSIIKHANANRVEIIMEYEPLQVCLAVSDDGIGIHTRVAGGLQSGIGLKNMQNRYDITEASLEIGLANSGGTSIRICLPVNHLLHNNSITQLV